MNKEQVIDIIVGGRGSGKTLKEYLNSIYGKESENNGSKNSIGTVGNGKKQNR